MCILWRLSIIRKNVWDFGVVWLNAHSWPWVTEEYVAVSKIICQERKLAFNGKRKKWFDDRIQGHLNLHWLPFNRPKNVSSLKTISWFLISFVGKFLFCCCVYALWINYWLSDMREKFFHHYWRKFRADHKFWCQMNTSVILLRAFCFIFDPVSGCYPNQYFAVITEVEKNIQIHNIFMMLSSQMKDFEEDTTKR